MRAVLEYEKFLYKYDYSYEDKKFSGLWAKLDSLRYNSDKVTGLVDKEGGPIGCDYSVYLFDDYAGEDIDKAVNNDIRALFKSLEGEVNYNNIYVLPEVFEAIKDSELLTDFNIFKYDYRNKMITINKPWIPDDFDINDYIPEEPVGTEYVTPRIMEGEGVNDINNFDVGYQLSSNANINSPVINAIEFTGHAESGLSFETATDYLMGVPFGHIFNETNETEYYNLYYIYNDPGYPNLVIELLNGSDIIKRTYTISEDTFKDFNIEEDHTYKMVLEMNSTDVKSTGIIHVVPSLYIDGNRLSTTDTGTLDFDISGGTRDFENWLSDFQTHIYLFGCMQGSNRGEFTVAAVPFEISNVTVYYTAGGDISQLDPGSTEGTWTLNAISYNTLSDGDNEYTLTPMSKFYLLVTNE